MTLPTPPVPPLEVQPGDPEPPRHVVLLRNHGRDEHEKPWLLRIDQHGWTWTSNPTADVQAPWPSCGWAWDQFVFSGPLMDCSEALRIKPEWCQQ